MTWLQLRLDTHPEAVEALEALMLATGAVAVTLQDNADQPVLEPGVGETPLWQQTRLSGLYQADSDMQTVLAHFPAGLVKDCQARVEILEDKDWEREWIKHYQPMRFGQRLWVCPSWLEPPQADAVNLLLDPGLAFGTGTHPTTAMCLRTLDALSENGQLDMAKVVDYGCGSGILAVAALKLGASEALGVDNDPQALTATTDNARRNGITPDSLITTLPGAASIIPWLGRADLVVANILAGPLLELRDNLLALARPGATLILSGLLATQADEVIAHYRGQLLLSIAEEFDGWICLQGQRPHT
ncbi:MAG: 50S ribosomal protein L11 methyltransferase [Parahaliea sp.]